MFSRMSVQRMPSGSLYARSFPYLSPPGRIAKEIGKRDRFAGRRCRFKYKIPYCNIQNAEPERRENARLMIKLDLVVENVHEGTCDEISVSGFHLGEMNRRACL